MDNLVNARRCLVDAENTADTNDSQLSQAYIAIANCFLRMEEIKNQKLFATYFDRKNFA